MRTTSVTQSLIDNQQMQIYSLKSQLTKANELIGKLEEALKVYGEGDWTIEYGVENWLFQDDFGTTAREALEEIAKWRNEK